MSLIVVVTGDSITSLEMRDLVDADVITVKPSLLDNVLRSMAAANRPVGLAVVAADVDGDLGDVGHTIQDHFEVPIIAVRVHPMSITTSLRRAGYVETITSDMAVTQLGRLSRHHLERPPAQGAPAATAPSATVVTGPEPDARPDGRRVVVVMSPKGGVGKTTISINLAVALARRAPLDTVIVDFDSQFGDVGSVLNLSATHSLADVFTEDGVQPTAVMKQMLTPFDHRLLVLAGSESPAALERITPRQERRVVRQLAAEYNHVVVDTGSGLTDETLAALEVATDVLFVTSMDISSVKALRRAIDVLEAGDRLPRHRHLMVNMTEPGTGLNIDDISRALKMSVDASIPRSVDITLSLNLGKPIVESSSSGALGTAVGVVADKLVGPFVPVPRRAMPSRRGR